MNLLRRYFNNIGDKLIMREANRNRDALECLLRLGFSLPRIRKALMTLNGIKINRLENGPSPGLIYATLKGTRDNGQARQILAEGLGLNTDEIFPPEKAG